MKTSAQIALQILVASVLGTPVLASPSLAVASAPADSSAATTAPSASTASEKSAESSPQNSKQDSKQDSKRKKKKFAKKPGPKKVEATAENKPPTQLPQYKRKTKVVIDFDSGSTGGSASPAVVDRSQMALAESERERAEADKLMRENFTRATDERVTPKRITRHKTVIVETNTTPTQPVQKPQPVIDVTGAAAGADIPNIEQTLKKPTLAPEPRHAPVIVADGDFEFNLHERSATESASPQPTGFTGISTPATPPPRATHELFGPPAPLMTPVPVQQVPPMPTPPTAAPQTLLFVGPPAPSIVMAAAAAPSPVPSPAAAGQVATTTQSQADFGLFAAPEAPKPTYHFLVRASYLDAQYSQLESNLQNGATSFAAGVSRTYGGFAFGTIEGSLAIDVGQGMDQAITLQDTRFVLLRAGASDIFLPGMISPIAGLSVGYGDFNVFSYHTTNGSTIELVENAQTSGLIAIPSAGVRLNLPSSYTLDLTAEYLVLLGGADASALGGLAGALTVGIPF